MGNLFGRSAHVAELEDIVAAKKDKDSRKRNSLAFNIASFVNFEEDDYQPLIDGVKAETKKKKSQPRAADISKCLIIEIILFLFYYCF